MQWNKRFTLVAASIHSFCWMGIAQTTTGSLSGSVRAVTGEKLVGANIKLEQLSSGTAFFVQSNGQGRFHFDNLDPGGPYSLEASFIGYRSAEKKELYVLLGEQLTIDIVLEPAVAQLQKIMVAASRRYANTGGIHTIIDRQKMEDMPGRHLYNFLATVPLAKPVAGTEGGVSFGGENNRYNSFYIDGAQSNDVFGLSASGTNGGQTGVSPVPMDAIEQLHISLTPYDASLGNFTGAAVNAVTRSGTNRPEVSVYYFGSNGKANDEDPLERNSSTNTFGIRWQGPIKKNKLFYFLNMESYRENIPYSFQIEDYKGNTNNARSFAILRNNLLANYHYDAGSFMENNDALNTTRMVARFDWNADTRHRFAFSGRFMQAIRVNSNNNSAEMMHAANDGFQLFHTSWSGTMEWKMRMGRHSNNRLLLAYTGVQDDRAPNGLPFPRVRIYDGDGSIVFGTDISSTINLLQQQNWVCTEKYTVIAGKHFLSVGIDAEYNHIRNAFIQNSFGNYSYRSIGDFLNNMAPVAYQLGFSLMDSIQNDDITAAARFSLLRYGFFINDEIRLGNNCTLQLGLRGDKYAFLSQPSANDFVNDTALPAFARYYHLQETRSGLASIAPSLSPRLGFQYKSSDGRFSAQMGAGIFNGRAPLAWPAGVYQYNGSYTGGYIAATTQLSRIRFRPNPYHQWQPAEVGASINKEPLNLLRKDFRMPSLLRSSLSIDQNFRNGWKLRAEIMYSKHLSEIVYTNINLLPPADSVIGPDNRLVYAGTNNARIPLGADSSNPYGYAILIGNQDLNTGGGWQVNLSLRKLLAQGLVMEIGYGFGRSYSLHDGTSSVNLSQWRLTETVNGRNTAQRSISDFDPGHQVQLWLNKKFVYGKRRISTTITLQYLGRSASPFSYVYSGSTMVRDDGNTGGYELVYIPRPEELAAMQFLPLIRQGKFYAPEQQKQALENYIRENDYLSTHRGQYAARNGSRLSFTHTINIKLIHDIALKITGHLYRFQLNASLFNLGNLIDPGWGLASSLPFDQFPLLEFAGYEASGKLVPQYRFDPFTTRPSAGNPGRYWRAELGLRISL
jgi:hypothetical protein